MNSLTDLNNLSMNYQYDDLRIPGFGLDPELPINQTIEIYESYQFNSPVGITVVEAIGAEAPDTYGPSQVLWDITGSKITNVSWSSLPSGVTLSKPTATKFLLSNVKTIEQWNAIKQPLCSPEIGYNGSTSFTVSLITPRNGTVTWTNSITLIPVPLLNNPYPSAFTDSLTQPIYGAPTIAETPYNTSIQYTMSVIPSNTSYVTTIASQSGLGTFNATTKKFEYTGTKANVTSVFSTLLIAFTSSATSNFTLSYTCKNLTSNETMTKVQNLSYVDVDYFSIPPAEEYYTNEGQFIAAPSITYTGSFVNLEISSDNANALSYLQFSRDNSQASNHFKNLEVYEEYIEANHSPNGEYFSVTIKNKNTNNVYTRIYYAFNNAIGGQFDLIKETQSDRVTFTNTGKALFKDDGLYVINNTNPNWVKESTPPNNIYGPVGISPNGLTYFIAEPTFIKIYVYSAGTWTLQQTLSWSGGGQPPYIIPTSVRLHNDLIAVTEITAPVSPTVFVPIVRFYKRTGNVWSLVDSKTNYTIIESTSNPSNAGQFDIDGYYMLLKHYINYPLEPDNYQLFFRNQSTNLWGLYKTTFRHHDLVDIEPNPYFRPEPKLGIDGVSILDVKSADERVIFQLINDNFVSMPLVSKVDNSATMYYDTSEFGPIQFLNYNSYRLISLYFGSSYLSPGNPNPNLNKLDVQCIDLASTTQSGATVQYNYNPIVMSLYGTRTQINNALSKLVALPAFDFISDFYLKYKLNLTGGNIQTYQLVQHKPLA